MHIVIIGNGIAGISTARHIRKLSDHRVTVISSETPYFWSRPALMYVYMGHMKYRHTKPYEDWFWEKNEIALVQDQVIRIVASEKSLQLKGGGSMHYDKLVLATGSSTNKFGWPGQDLIGVQGMVSKQDLDTMMERSPDIQHAVIVGGGLIGIEMAEMFHSRHIPVTFLVRESSFWNLVIPAEESAMINREIRRHDPAIDLRLNTELEKIIPDSVGKVKTVVTKQGEEIDCQFVGLTAGVHPNIHLAEGTDIETNRGFLVDGYLQTSVEGIYAVGDCAELRQPDPGRKAVEAVWYTGKLMGPVLAQTLCGTPTEYHPGVWFNSAKFLDIEYQIYGEVPIEENDELRHLYWEHPDGRKSVRLVYETHSGKIRGFNLMGIRYRQEVCTHWIESGTHIESVLQDLGAANFDPEFFKQYESEVVALYNRQEGKSLKLRSKRGLRSMLKVLSGV